MSPGAQPGSQIRPPQRGGKPFAMPPPQSGGPQVMNKMPGQYQHGPQGPHMHPQHPHHPHQQQHMQQSPHHGPQHPQQQQHPQHPQTMMQPKREVVFPPDTVEATQPLLYRRKRLTKHDIGPTDPWRIFMALRSGLLAESTWALDVLNVLLFDDTAIVYFGLNHLPGLLNLLLEHFQKSLADMFETKTCASLTALPLEEITHKKELLDVVEEGEDGDSKLSSNLNNNSDSSCNNNQIPAKIESLNVEVDLGAVTVIPSSADRMVVFKSLTNYTLQSRKGVPVKLQDASSDIFVMDHQRDWDKLSNRDYYLTATVGDDPWTVGHQEPNTVEYIMDCFKAEFAHIPFAKFIKGKNGVGRRSDLCDKKMSSSAPKRMRMSVDEPEVLEVVVEEVCEKSKTIPIVHNKVNNAVLKKESNVDSDCRQVDMELEKIPNGPTTITGENGSNENSNESAVKVKVEPEPESESEKMETSETVKEFNLTTTVKDPAKILKRRRMSDYEDECYTRDEASLHLITDSQDALARRCICMSTILRNLTFVPGNETEFAKSAVFLSILGKLLLINHEHPVRTKKQRNYDREEDADFSDSCSSLQGEHEWWWDFLVQIRENMLVATANIAGHMDLSGFDEPISRPVLDGLLHWAVCPSAHGQDPFPSINNHTVLSPQRLALEALCKMCVTDANVDLVIATPPFSRLEKLCAVLTRHLCKNEDQVLREFSVNLLHYLAAADSTMSRTVAKQSPCVSYLVAFIEQAEQTALGVANQHGINFLRENPDSMGTSLDMLRRAAGTLLHLAKHPDNRPLFMQQEQRLLGLVMSHILDQQVALIISRVLFQCSRGTGPLTTTQLEQQYSQKALAEIPTLTKDDSITAASLQEQIHKQSGMANNHLTQQLQLPQQQQLTAMKSPPVIQQPLPLTPPPIAPSATVVIPAISNEDMKAKLNAINKPLPANPTPVVSPPPTPATPTTTTTSSSSSPPAPTTPAIQQTVTASS